MSTRPTSTRRTGRGEGSPRTGRGRRDPRTTHGEHSPGLGADRGSAGHGSLRRSESGSTTLEFVGVALLLVIPVIYLVLTMARIQAAGFAATSAAREAARAWGTARDDAAGRARAQAAVDLALGDQGFASDGAALGVTCGASPCLTPGADIHLTVRVQVPLPGLPDSLAGAAPAAVPVEAHHVVAVDDYRETGADP